MKSVGSFEAKTNLAALLERVSRGETIVITKHGRPVARLVPPEQDGPTMSVADAISGLLEFRKAHRMGRDELKALVIEGRKYGGSSWTHRSPSPGASQTKRMAMPKGF